MRRGGEGPERGSGPGSPAGTRPAGFGAGRGGAQPPFPRRRGPVTKLPSYRRIRELLTGEAAANQRAAALFSGRRPGDTRTFPRHPAKHADTQSQWRARTHTVPGTRSIARPHTLNHSDTHCDIHRQPQEHASRHTASHQHTKSQCHRHSPRTHSTTQIHNHNDTQPCLAHAVSMT